MNKIQFIAALKAWASDQKIDLNECHVSHGGSLLMLGLRDATDDIDLTVSQSIWDRFIDQGYPVQYIAATATYPEVHIINVTNDIDLHLNDLCRGLSLMKEDGILFRDAQNTLSDKLRLNRTKDQADIDALKKYLKI